MSLTQKIETPTVTYEQPLGLYINGEWVKGKEGKTFETINPTNEKPIVAVHEAGPEGEFGKMASVTFSAPLPASVPDQAALFWSDRSCSHLHARGGGTDAFF